MDDSWFTYTTTNLACPYPPFKGMICTQSLPHCKTSMSRIMIYRRIYSKMGFEKRTIVGISIHIGVLSHLNYPLSYSSLIMIPITKYKHLPNGLMLYMLIDPQKLTAKMITSLSFYTLSGTSIENNPFNRRSELI